MVTQCANCGATNPSGSRFCAECGAALSPEVLDHQPASRLEAPLTAQPTDDEWRMSDAGPLPERPRRRRTLLWIVVGILAACLLICLGALVWLSTGAGSEWLDDFTTQIAELGTETAQ